MRLGSILFLSLAMLSLSIVAQGSDVTSENSLAAPILPQKKDTRSFSKAQMRTLYTDASLPKNIKMRALNAVGDRIEEWSEAAIPSYIVFYKIHRFSSDQRSTYSDEERILLWSDKEQCYRVIDHRENESAKQILNRAGAFDVNVDYGPPILYTPPDPESGTQLSIPQLGDTETYTQDQVSRLYQACRRNSATCISCLDREMNLVGSWSAECPPVYIVLFQFKLLYYKAHPTPMVGRKRVLKWDDKCHLYRMLSHQSNPEFDQASFHGTVRVYQRRYR